MKTSELADVSLDYWVMRALGYQRAGELPLGVTGCIFDASPCPWNPSESWAQGGPIIDRQHIDVEHGSNQGEDFDWRASAPAKSGMTDFYEGETALIAAMRAFVASKFGNEVAD